MIVTKTDIIKGLKEIGLEETDTIMVHSSLSKFGWVVGGPQAVVEALLETVPKGTIFMSSQTFDNSEPTYWVNPPVPKEWHPLIRETMPAYDKHLTLPRGMGRVVDTFLALEGIERSNHPQASFCGYGMNAKEYLKEHQIDYALYKNTPVEKFYNNDIKILLLGVDYDVCTLMHYAEYEAKIRKEIKQGFAYLEDGKRVWRESTELDLDSDIFLQVGIELEKDNRVIKGNIGKATIKVLGCKDAIDYAVDYFNKNRDSIV